MAAKKTLDTVLAADKAGEVISVDPTFLEKGINSRIHEEPGQDKKVIELAYSIFKNGQRVPAICRRIGTSLTLVAGFTRLAAVTAIRNGFEHNGESCKDESRKLLVSVDAANTDDKDAFIASVLENVRNEVSPINVAEQQKRLVDDFGFTKTEVATLYGYGNTNSVSANEKLLQCPKDILDRVHKGEISRDAALTLAKLPEEDRKELIAAGQTTKTAIREHVAEKREEEAEKPKAGGDPTPKAVTTPAPAVAGPRNAAAIKVALKELLGGDDEAAKDALPEVLRSYLEGLLLFAEGEGTIKRLKLRQKALVEAIG